MEKTRVKGRASRKKAGFTIWLFARRAFIAGLVGASMACLLAASLPPSTESASRGALTVAERIAYQRAIEEVYWRHRIWPKENSGAKPALEAVMAQAQIEEKVEDYLRTSQLVAEQRGWPITASELQAEMERMARQTRKPQVLRELFAALENDPFVVAECLARPIVAGRLVSVVMIGAGPTLVRASLRSSAALPAGYKLPKIWVPLDCADNTWTAATTVNAPEVRHVRPGAAVWTGSEMILWGGTNSNGALNNLNTGGRYTPSTDSWTDTTVANAPLGRGGHTTVWTGREVIVWGGANYPTGDLNTGGRYNPATNTWTATSTTNAPSGRGSHSAIWTGSEMIVWGGTLYIGNDRFNSGGRYNPGTDTWTATSTANAPSARWDHTALWIGSEMIVWGGTDQTNYLRTGGKYTPATDTWTPTRIPDSSIPGRVAHTAVWTGSEMIVWGGVDETFHDTSTGGRYNSGTDSWIATGVANGAPSPRSDHTAVWTGREMIVWGGNSPTASLNTGKRYNPDTDAWTLMTTANAPVARSVHTAVWTGNEMIVWGGDDNNGLELNTGGRYCAQPSTPLVQSAVSRKTHGNAGSFDLNLPLTGPAGIESRSGGATGDYTIVLTFLANVSVSGSPQAAITSGIGNIGSGGVSNGGTVTTSGNVVTIPLTNVANAQTINITLNNVNGATNLTIPMAVLLGDTNGDGFVNSGDALQTRNRAGQTTDATNFRSDVNLDGFINSGDSTLVRARSGTFLP
ncbi:MAG: dockerin type I domain-containing protein [Acidobacteriota bacterium]|nr:dockerin type I domain-containing protein [Acidobacteriota bacterium]